MNSSEIRKAFIDYFKENGHQEVASSSLVPFNDQTLLFTNAGMVQFKDVFLGMDVRPYTRATTSQRCVRAGGKHNDLENVGYTARHQTFFEMLGNFSFGDYFKKEAIHYAWEFLTNTLKLPKSKLWISVHESDFEAYDIWVNDILVPKERISRCGDDDNFWSMGDTGPCGPCTEIFYDHGPEIAGGPPGSIDSDGDRYIEIWNMVFMQYNRDKDGVMHKLPKPSVDTGMGLERISAVVQHVHNNYDIDSFQKIIASIAKLGKNVDVTNPSVKVIADHIRACVFLIADGVIPSNEGRGYVLRRILRRAIRHGHKLHLEMPFFYKLVNSIVEVMGDAYSFIIEQQEIIAKTILQEEEQFARTLDQGLKLLQEHIATLGKNKIISGAIAFKLYDTYGFPLDLTSDIAREHNLTVDNAEFTKLMDNQRQQSQSSNQFQADEALPISLDSSCDFVGYEKNKEDTIVTAIFVDNKNALSVSDAKDCVVVLNKSPFYAESGGQVGDEGTITGDNFTFKVVNTKKQGQAILHYGVVTHGVINVNSKAVAEIDILRRNSVRLNHTATHLLHAALKQIIGSNAMQKGSLVDFDRARFDFSHNFAILKSDLIKIEDLVNAKIRENYLVSTDIMPIDEAKKSGAAALFGEKYTDMVRVLSIDNFSKELCGGTHVKRTGDIGIFKIINEYGVASGVRRIEFVTGKYALEWINEELSKLSEVANILKTQPKNVVEKVQQSINSLKVKDKEILKLQQEMLQQSGDSLLDEKIVIDNKTLLIKRMDNLDSHGLRAMLDKLKSSIDRAIVVLYAVNDDKINVIAGVSKSILGEVPSAGLIVKELCGRGGGRDDMAQGGGIVPSDLEDRVKKIKEMLTVSCS